ncbi:MAG TPA: hypothetical protein V6C89_08435 [Drouetiella sp.]|jgi:hypothetical protein
MPFYIVEPEVPGRFGKQCVFKDRLARPPVVEKLHYEFDGWSGDDLLSVILTYIGTLRLAAALQKLDPPVSGVEFDDVVVTKSSEYRRWGELQPDNLDDFVWLKINGDVGVDDFGIAGRQQVGVADRYLVVSERVLATLRSLNFSQGTAVEYLHPSSRSM